MAKIYLFLILVSLLSGVGYGGYSYYLWSQETMNTLRENNVKLKSAAETLQNTVNTMKADAEKNEKLNRDLSKRLQQSNEHLNKLRGVFAKIDLTMEALTNAQGLEDRVNNAVNKLIGRIQDETTPPSDKPDDTGGVSGETGGAGSSSNN
jgi:DNA repair exonuclease SbcCD ATPase subunit